MNNNQPMILMLSAVITYRSNGIESFLVGSTVITITKHPYNINEDIADLLEHISNDIKRKKTNFSIISTSHTITKL
jgi:hypothetical protein